MNESNPHSQDALANASREEIMAVMFANMVVQQANMAMMLMGKAPHPETGQIIKDLDGARMFIEQLEMLEAKTKGNLSKQEDGLLKQALAAVRMSFVESMDEQPPQAAAPSQRIAPDAAPKPSPTPDVQASAATPSPEAPAASTEESRKKFSKKY